MAPDSTRATPIAAGGVPFRQGDGGLLLAVVHRPRYDDWSFPKGKLEPGESSLLAAVREVGEETGLRITLGRRLPATSYQADGTDKFVHWWAMPAAGTFAPNDEVDRLDWLPVGEARGRLSYPDDVELVCALEEGFPRVQVLVVRHASAGDRGTWSDRDDERPLDQQGRAEAAALAAGLRWFRPTRIVSAEPLRCRQTVQPLAAAVGLDVLDAPDFGEDRYWAAPEGPRGQVAQWLRDPAATTVVCSQGGAIPDLLGRVLSRVPTITGVSSRRRDPDPPCRKGSVWALAADAAGRIRSADYYGSLLPPG